uniref:Uncharacterized protein n=1 Tax=Micrurus lemniscatus lemniscatus TaxID=129467 RepID=A0A2D4HGA3_MICLE
MLSVESFCHLFNLMVACQTYNTANNLLIFNFYELLQTTRFPFSTNHFEADLVTSVPRKMLRLVENILSQLVLSLADQRNDTKMSIIFLSQWVPWKNPLIITL